MITKYFLDFYDHTCVSSCIVILNCDPNDKKEIKKLYKSRTKNTKSFDHLTMYLIYCNDLLYYEFIDGSELLCTSNNDQIYRINKKSQIINELINIIFYDEFYDVTNFKLSSFSDFIADNKLTTTKTSMFPNLPNYYDCIYFDFQDYFCFWSTKYHHYAININKLSNKYNTICVYIDDIIYYRVFYMSVAKFISYFNNNFNENV